MVALGPWAVEMIGAALGMEHRKGRVVIWGRWVGEAGAAWGLLDVGHHGAWRCSMAGAVREALAVCQGGQVLQGGAGAGGC